MATGAYFCDISNSTIRRTLRSSCGLFLTVDTIGRKFRDHCLNIHYAMLEIHLIRLHSLNIYYIYIQAVLEKLFSRELVRTGYFSRNSNQRYEEFYDLKEPDSVHVSYTDFETFSRSTKNVFVCVTSNICNGILRILDDGTFILWNTCYWFLNESS